MAGLGMLLASCEPPSRLLDRLDDPEPQVLRLSCGEEYKVFERTKPPRLIVATTLGQEYDRKPCPGYETLNRLERFRKLALEHLTSTGRKSCSVSDEKVVAATEVSVRYRCPGDGQPDEPTPDTKTSRGKGRPR